ncbi:hypothetical protein PENFLA_c094G05070 [Penicillium flavigenum]|uniref:Uncharacterized protein n=1 Tax=Penicillium flavigenum TaxID=254877 RepID=A0A1V6S7R9_9EURO|nr:hypothetical protein PENFLA_c094G05070 [Penicillium flavigenum]
MASHSNTIIIADDEELPNLQPGSPRPRRAPRCNYSDEDSESMFIDAADDEGRSRKRKRTEKKKPSALDNAFQLLNKEVRHEVKRLRKKNRMRQGELRQEKERNEQRAYSNILFLPKFIQHHPNIMGFSILSVEEIDTPFVLQDEQPDDIARFSASAVILVMALNGLPYTFFVYEHRYAKMMNVKAKRTPGRSPWEPPEGGFEASGQTILGTAKRETKEEVNLSGWCLTPCLEEIAEIALYGFVR